MRTVLILLLLLPHAAIFIYAGIREFRAWRRLDRATRPSFLGYLGRAQGTADQLSPIRRLERGEPFMRNAAAATAQAGREHRARTGRSEARRPPQRAGRAEASLREVAGGAHADRQRPDARARGKRR